MSVFGLINGQWKQLQKKNLTPVIGSIYYKFVNRFCVWMIWKKCNLYRTERTQVGSTTSSIIYSLTLCTSNKLFKRFKICFRTDLDLRTKRRKREEFTLKIKHFFHCLYKTTLFEAESYVCLLAEWTRNTMPWGGAWVVCEWNVTTRVLHWKVRILLIFLEFAFKS